MSVWARILTGMLARGAVTAAILDGALARGLITPGEHEQLAGALAESETGEPLAS